MGNCRGKKGNTPRDPPGCSFFSDAIKRMIIYILFRLILPLAWIMSMCIRGVHGRPKSGEKGPNMSSNWTLLEI